MNIQTILIAAAVAAIFIKIVYTEYRNHRDGKCTCSCGCENCASQGCCHQNSSANL